MRCRGGNKTAVSRCIMTAVQIPYIRPLLQPVIAWRLVRLLTGRLLSRRLPTSFSLATYIRVVMRVYRVVYSRWIITAQRANDVLRLMDSGTQNKDALNLVKLNKACCHILL